MVPRCPREYVTSRRMEFNLANLPRRRVDSRHWVEVMGNPLLRTPVLELLGANFPEKDVSVVSS